MSCCALSIPSTPGGPQTASYAVASLTLHHPYAVRPTFTSKNQSTGKAGSLLKVTHKEYTVGAGIPSQEDS